MSQNQRCANRPRTRPRPRNREKDNGVEDEDEDEYEDKPKDGLNRFDILIEPENPVTRKP
jgi:hypothetical protein